MYYGGYTELSTADVESGKKSENDDLYLVYPAKVTLFFEEVICRQTITKHIPPGADISITMALANEDIDGDGLEDDYMLDSNDLTQSK